MKSKYQTSSSLYHSRIKFGNPSKETESNKGPEKILSRTSVSPLYIEIDITEKNVSELNKKKTNSTKNLEFNLSSLTRTPETCKRRPSNRPSLEPCDYGAKTPLRKSYVPNPKSIVSPREYSLGKQQFLSENKELKRQLMDANNQIEKLKGQLETQQRLREMYVCKN